MNEISNRFIETYKSMKLTGYKMGKVSSVITKQKISNIEKGITDVSIDIISDFCKIYKTADAFYILTGYEQEMKVQVSSPPFSEKENFYKEMFEKKDAEVGELKEVLGKFKTEKSLLEDKYMKLAEDFENLKAKITLKNNLSHGLPIVESVKSAHALENETATL